MIDFERLGIHVDPDGGYYFACQTCLHELTATQAFDTLQPANQSRLLNRLAAWQRSDGRCQLCEVSYGLAGAGRTETRERGRSPWAHANAS